MSELKHELVNAGYIMTINRPAEGVRLMIPMIRDVPPDPTIMGGGPVVIDVAKIEEDTSPFMRHHGATLLGWGCIYNPGAHFLLSGNAIQAVRDHADITCTSRSRTVYIQGQTEKNLKSDETQFHKLTAVMTLRPVTLEAAYDAADLMRLDNSKFKSSFAVVQGLIPAFDAVAASLEELDKFHIGSNQDNKHTVPLIKGHIALRRNKIGEDSYIQSSEYDLRYINKRKRIEEEEVARRSPKGRPDYFEVSDLGRAFHFHSAKDSLLAIAHFKTAAPGDKFFAAHAEYIVSEEPISLAQMKDLALKESISSLDPRTQDMIKRLSQKKLAL